MIDDSGLKEVLAQAGFLKEAIEKVANKNSLNDHILIIGESGMKKRLIAEILHEKSYYWKDKQFKHFENTNDFWGFFYEYYRDIHDLLSVSGEASDKKKSVPGIYDGIELCAIIGNKNTAFEIKTIGKGSPPTIENIIINQRQFAATVFPPQENNLRIIALQKDNGDDDDLFNIQVNVPPLKDMPDIIKPIVDLFLHGGSVKYDDEFLGKLKGHPWPNNIDELVNVLTIAQSNLKGNENCLGINHLPPSVYEPPVEIFLPDDFLEDEADSNISKETPAPENKEDNDKKRRVSPEIIEKAKELDKKYEAFRAIVSNDPIIAKLKVDIHKYAQKAKNRTDKSQIILFTGETGVGKELFAKAYYDALENKGAFVSVNLTTLPSTIIERELFGHVKGAFTGADKDQPGLFEAATDGTIFLDEFGELETNLQTRFLRVFEEREIFPVGSNKNKEINAHIVLATNKNLKKMVKQNTFREDLYHRIDITINIPPLRERRDDIPLLIDHFLKDTDFKFAEKALKQMQMHQWPGNVRELKNVVRKAMTQGYYNDVSSFLSNKDDKAIEKPPYDYLKNYERLIKLCKEGKSKSDIAKKIPSPDSKKDKISRPALDNWIDNIHDNKKIMGYPIQDYLRKKDKVALECTLKKFLPKGRRQKRRS